MKNGLPTYTVANDGGLFYHHQRVIPFGNAHLVNEKRQNRL